MNDENPVVIVVAIILIIAIAVGGFYVKRWFNSKLYYNSASEKIVCEMVKPEYLKNPEVCK